MRWALPVLFVGGVVVALSGILARLSELGPAATAFHRFAWAAPLLWLWPLLFPPGAVPAERDAAGRTRDILHLAIGGAFLGLDIGVWHWAIELGTVTNASLLGNTGPVFVVLAAWLIFREAITARFLIGLLLALAGIAILLSGSFSLSARHLLGDVCGLAAGALYAAYLLSMNRLRSRFSTARVAFWTAASSAALLLPLALVSGEALLPSTLDGWLIVLGLAILVQIVGHGMITWALAHLPATFASVALLINPVATTLMAWLILEEAIGWHQLIGGVIVLGGIVVARQATRVAPAADPTAT